MLGYSVEDNMEPKLEFLADGRSTSLVRRAARLGCDWVVKNPSCLGYSLASRYRPRIEACRAAGVDTKRVLSYGSRADEIFCEKIGIAPEALVAARESVLSVTAAASRARPPVAAPRRRAFSTRAETTAQNAADVRDLLRTRLSLTDAEVDRVERHQPAGARATVEPKLGWLQSRLELDAAQLGKMVVRHPQLC